MERNNREILYITLRREFLASSLAAFGIILFLSVSNSKEVLEVFSDAKFFSSLIIQSIIGIVALTATVIFSVLLKIKGNEHLPDDWEFRTGFTKIVFISLIATGLAFLLPFGKVTAKDYYACLSQFGSWLTLTTIILTLVGFWHAVGSIRRVVGYSKAHD